MLRIKHLYFLNFFNLYITFSRTIIGDFENSPRNSHIFESRQPQPCFWEAMPERIYNSHYGNGVPVMFIS